MADFHTHITVAAAASLLAGSSLLQAGTVTLPQAAVLVFAGTVAGLLPDVDSDHSIPAQWLFRLLSAVLFALVWQMMPASMPTAEMLLYAGTSALLMRYPLVQLFTRITVHRGLFHSLPAAMLAGLAMAAMGQCLLHWPPVLYQWSAVFVCGGYLLHLLLDELFSVNLMGASLKASFGTALTLFSPASWLSYVLMYSAVIVGAYLLTMP